MSAMAQWASLIWADPTDDDVSKRNRAVDRLAGLLGDGSPRDALKDAAQIATTLAGGDFSTQTATAVEEAIGAFSEAFRLEGRELQGRVCLAVAALEVVGAAPTASSGWEAPDALAAGLWSALSAQGPLDGKLGPLRTELLQASRARALEVARAARERLSVPEVGTLAIPEDAPAGGRANTAYRRATAPVIVALSRNAELDREELDFLWWALAGWSDPVNCALSNLPPLEHAVAAGISAGGLLRRLPDDGLRHVALRGVNDCSVTAFSDALGALAPHAAKLVASLPAGWSTVPAEVVPLLSGLSGAVVPSAVATLDARDWGARALLESAIVHLDGRLGGVAG